MSDTIEGIRDQIDKGANEDIVDKMPVSGSIFGILTIIAGLYFGITQSVGYFTLSLAATIFSVMISVSIGWNRVYSENDYASATPILHLLLASLFVFVLLYYSFYVLFPISNFLFIGSVALGCTLSYQYILLRLLFYNQDRDRIEVGEHPFWEDDQTAYVFKESMYIPLLEEKAVEKQKQES